MAKPKKVKRRLVSDITSYIDDSSLDEVISWFSNIPANYPDYSNFYFSAEYDLYDTESTRICLYAIRDETDKERDKRLKAAKRKRERNKKRKEERVNVSENNTND